MDNERLGEILTYTRAQPGRVSPDPAPSVNTSTGSSTNHGHMTATELEHAPSNLLSPCRLQRAVGIGALSRALHESTAKRDIKSKTSGRDRSDRGMENPEVQERMLGVGLRVAKTSKVQAPDRECNHMTRPQRAYLLEVVLGSPFDLPDDPYDELVPPVPAQPVQPAQSAQPGGSLGWLYRLVFFSVPLFCNFVSHSSLAFSIPEVVLYRLLGTV